MAAPTAAPPAARCSATASWPSPGAGAYTLGNIAPACRSCNTSKCNAEVTGWLRRKGYDEQAFLLRHLDIQTGLAVRFPAEPKGRETTLP